MRLNNAQRGLLADKLMDTGNYALIGLVFEQLLSRDLKPQVLAFGLLLFVWLLSVAMLLKKGVRDSV